MYGQAHVYLHVAHRYICIHIYAYACVCINVYMFSINVCMHACMYVCMYACMHVMYEYMYICMDACVRIYLCICTHIRFPLFSCLFLSLSRSLLSRSVFTCAPSRHTLVVPLGPGHGLRLSLDHTTGGVPGAAALRLVGGMAWGYEGTCQV